MPPRELPSGKIDPSLLRQLLKELPTSDRVLIKPGVGVDSSGLRVDSDRIAVAVDPITFAGEDLHFYSIAVNVNDVVCQGCEPLWYSVSLLLPPGTTETKFKSLWHSLNEVLNDFRIDSAGGHTEVTDAVNRPVLAGQVIGEPLVQDFLDPAAAEPGDHLYQWRPAGIEGLALLAREHGQQLSNLIPDDTGLDYYAKLLEDPGICVWPDCRHLFKTGDLKALHDPTEGGLATGVHELAEAAGCGVEVFEDNILWPRGIKKLLGKLGADPLGLLSSGCLLAVYPEKLSDQSADPGAPCNITRIGRLTDSSERKLVAGDGVGSPLPRYHRDQLLTAFENLEDS